MKLRVSGFWVAVLLLGHSGPGWAVEPHDHGGHSVPVPVLNHGAKWPTDEPLRQGMERLRQDLAAVQGHSLSLVAQGMLADKLQGHIDYLVRNCKLSPAADAQLHGILEPIIAGAAMLKSNSDATAGMTMIQQALEVYGRFFDHPGWLSPFP